MNLDTDPQGIILIVDDTPTNLSVLFDLLSASHFKVLVAQDGEDALDLVEYAPPDLILLDVIMPGIDGFETCSRLKANESTKDIPVIFMTALADTVDKVKGLNLGAVDYITKPFQHEEVLARVNIHMNIRNLTKKLQEKNTLLQGEIEQRAKAEDALLQLTSKLETRVAERTAELFNSNELLRQSNHRLKQEIEERRSAEAALQHSEAQLRTQAKRLEQTLRELQQTQVKLIHTEKMSSLGQLVAGIAHEINNPINFICGNLTYANAYTQDLIHLLNLYQNRFPDPGPEIQEEIGAIELEFLLDDLPKLLGSMKVGVDRIREVIHSLRIFSRLDEAQMKPVDIHHGIDSTLLILHNRLKFRADCPEIEVIKEYGTLPKVECYAGQLNQVFMNILSNAIDAIEEKSEVWIQKSQEHKNSSGLWLLDSGSSPMIRIRTEWLENGHITIAISDNGFGIAEEVQQHLFDPFFTTKPVGKGTGMGLSISYQIVVEKHQGDITCRSVRGMGTEFIIEIPIKQSSHSCVTVGALS